MPHAPAHFRIFLSSPGDVADERALARRALQNLLNQPFIRNRASVQIVAWDNPEAGTPLFANLTPQEAINRQLLSHLSEEVQEHFRIKSKAVERAFQMLVN